MNIIGTKSKALKAAKQYNELSDVAMILESFRKQLTSLDTEELINTRLILTALEKEKKQLISLLIEKQTSHSKSIKYYSIILISRYKLV